MRTIPLALIASLVMPGATVPPKPNSLSDAERRAGWTLLFDGTSLAAWDDPGRRQPAGTSWKAEDGWIVAQPKPRIREDLVTLRDFADFELEFEWRLAAGSNSGVKYRVQEVVFIDFSRMPPKTESIQDQLRYEISHRASDRRAILPASRGKDYSIGFEFQIIDDGAHPDSRAGAGKHATGALYDMVAPSSAPARPAGEVNSARIVVRGDAVQHWINGVRVVAAELDAAPVREGLAERWGEGHPVYRLLTGTAQKRGRIALTHHGDRASFRSIRIRELRH